MLENRVVDLTNRNDMLQDSLSDIIHIAAQLKAYLISSKKDTCDNLMNLQLGKVT